ncbi:DUF4112 domain-containing protein [Nocardioidaceae bacterium]|nr:DUF4112 domain-containing protein [Nocardioidaceae bacterium]
MTPELEKRRARHQRLARVMDEAVRVPGTRLTIGLDPVIGLVPGIGDLAGSAVSSIILTDAVRSRVPVPVLGRMGWNIIVDALLGLVPLVGDAADVVHRAHRKNSRLLSESLESGTAGAIHGRGPTVGYVAAAVLVAFLPLVLALVVAVVALVAVVSLVL